MNGMKQEPWEPIPCMKQVELEHGDKELFYKVFYQLVRVEEELRECRLVWREMCYLHRETKDRMAEELTDVVTAATTAMEILGYDLGKRREMQEFVNEKNKSRDYW